MNILGVSAGFHDAAVTLINQHGDILFAGHSERYSKQKNDADISLDLLNEIDMSTVDTIAYYERPLYKQLRQWYSGQGIECNKLTTTQILKQQLGADRISGKTIKSYNHHLCHAAAGFQTSTFDQAAVVVIDAIGEFETASIYQAQYDSNGCAKYRCLWQQRYPHSIGLFYSAVTQRVGLKPLDEEYITMGMSAYGNLAACTGIMYDELVKSIDDVTFKQNLHAGIDSAFAQHARDEDIAAAGQYIAEQYINSVMLRAQKLTGSKNLVYMGGVALNCLANRNLGNYFEKIWIMPCPSDAGSSLGAGAMAHGGSINWTNSYLGHNIAGDYPVNAIIDNLISTGIVGVASGRAEFGPRALGNRSLLADPRGMDIKEKVNAIKRRQQFRPFAPVILEEHVDMYFDMPGGFPDSRYMQVIARCRHPHIFPAIIHHDHTSRVQTVPRDGSGIRQLLEAWYAQTGCPMLLNTSLNIRGEPMVNDRTDADRFERLYDVKVCS